MRVRIVSIAVSRKKGTPKQVVDEALVIQDHGIEGDAHAGPWHRQVSFLSAEGIRRARAKGMDVDYGAFAENIATEGLDWSPLGPGSRLRLGSDVLVEITQVGKECHAKCAVHRRTGDCIMPREGIFARVLAGGRIRRGDPIALD